MGKITRTVVKRTKRIYEEEWTCAFCKRENLGRTRDCEGCGKPRDNTTLFQDPPERLYVSNEKAQTISRQPDWACEICGNLTSDRLDHCQSCGHERTGKSKTYWQLHPELKAEQIYEQPSTSSTASHSSSFQENNHSTFVASPKPTFKSSFKTPKISSNFWHVVLAILLVIAIATGLYFLLVPREKTLTVQQFSWNRSISIERYKPVSEEGWDEPPIGAYSIHSEERFYGTEKVYVRTDTIVTYEKETSSQSFGNGYGEETEEWVRVEEEVDVYEDVDVYKTYYFYKIDKWVYERSVNTSGTDKEPYWGKTDLHYKERESGTSESYQIVGIDSEGKSTTVSLQYETWKALYLGETYKMMVNLLGYGTLANG